jgi:enterobactin synthetase component D
LWQQSGIDLPANIAKAVPKRQAEYLAGRYLVRQLQSRLMLPQTAVISALDRSPVWPAGSSGSISHSHGAVWAGLSPQTGISLGLDVEQVFSDAQLCECADQILSQEEQYWLNKQPFSLPLMHTLAFAAKEALYKALYPDCQQIKEFTAAGVSAISPTRIELCLTEDWSPEWSAGQCISLDYWHHSGKVWVACEVIRRTQK